MAARDLPAFLPMLALGLPETADGVPTTALTQFLQPRDLLLVLDNCEPHVAACAELAEALLRACPDLQILATQLFVEMLKSGYGAATVGLYWR